MASLCTRTYLHFIPPSSPAACKMGFRLKRALIKFSIPEPIKEFFKDELLALIRGRRHTRALIQLPSPVPVFGGGSICGLLGMGSASLGFAFLIYSRRFVRNRKRNAGMKNGGPGDIIGGGEGDSLEDCLAAAFSRALVQRNIYFAEGDESTLRLSQFLDV